MSRFTADEAIDRIKAVKVSIFGMQTQKFNYGHEIREELQKMSEKNMISPAEFYQASKIVFNSSCMLDSCKSLELKQLSQ